MNAHVERVLAQLDRGADAGITPRAYVEQRRADAQDDVEAEECVECPAPAEEIVDGLPFCTEHAQYARQAMLRAAKEGNL